MASQSRLFYQSEAWVRKKRKISDDFHPFVLYVDEMAQKGAPYRAVVPFIATIDLNCANGNRLTTLPANYFLYLGSFLSDEVLNAISEFKTHYKLAFVMDAVFPRVTIKFQGTIDQLHIRSHDVSYLKITLDLFHEVIGQLHEYYDLKIALYRLIPKSK